MRRLLTTASKRSIKEANKGNAVFRTIDAEAQPMPEMFNTVQWEEMKRFILKAVEEYNASF